MNYTTKGGNDMSQNFNNNMYKPEQLIAGLTETGIPMNQLLAGFRETSTSLTKKIIDLIQNTFGIAEIDNVVIVPEVRRGGNDLCDIKCAAYFNTSLRDINTRNITRVGKGNSLGNGDGRINAVIASGRQYDGASGDFNVTDDFKKQMLPIAADTDGNKLKLKAVPSNKNIAYLELDFMAVIGAALSIGPKDPYDFSILSCEVLKNGNNRDELPEYQLIIVKFIDTNSSRRGHHKSSSVNYSAIARDFVQSVNGGRNNNNNGGGRNWN
jgi:hypothetical protein